MPSSMKLKVVTISQTSVTLGLYVQCHYCAVLNKGLQKVQRQQHCIIFSVVPIKRCFKLKFYIREKLQFVASLSHEIWFACTICLSRSFFSSVLRGLGNELDSKNSGISNLF